MSGRGSAGFVPVRVCIASTVREPERLLEPFLRYHLQSGFEHIFLFFDDPGEPAPNGLAQDSRVSVIRSTEQLRTQQLAKAASFQERGFARFPGEYPDVTSAGMIDGPGHTGLIVRQQLNLFDAMSLARSKGFEWLLSIDVDELFLSTKQSLGEHFGSLSDRGHHFCRYLNHEAVPERANIDDPFLEMTLFMLNPQDARRRSTVSDGRPFRGYHNGKSAIRLRRPALPSGSHRFRPMSGIWSEEELQFSEDPCMLHYAECGFERFARKYAMLGKFPDEYFRGAPANPWLRECRDLFQGGDLERARRFYEDRAVATGDLADLWLRKGICRRIDGPARMLSRPIE